MQVDAASHISHANHGSHASASRVEALVVQLSVGDTARGGDSLRENENRRRGRTTSHETRRRRHLVSGLLVCQSMDFHDVRDINFM